MPDPRRGAKTGNVVKKFSKITQRDREGAINPTLNGEQKVRFCREINSTKTSGGKSLVDPTGKKGKPGRIRVTEVLKKKGIKARKLGRGTGQKIAEGREKLQE